MNDHLVTLLTIIVTGSSILGTLYRWVYKPIRKLARDNEQFRIDWYGRGPLPSMPKRLESIEYQLKPNSGHSMRDAVDRVEVTLVRHVSDGHGGQ